MDPKSPFSDTTLPKGQTSVRGFMFRERFFYWGGAKHYSEILESRFEKTVRSIVNIVALVFTVGGFLAFAVSLWAENDFNGLRFMVSGRSWELLWFWLSLLVVMYIIYRVDQDARWVKPVAVDAEKEDAVSESEPRSFEALKKEQRVDIQQSFAYDARKALDSAWHLAALKKHPAVSSWHLLLALLQATEAHEIFGRLGMPSQQLAKNVDVFLDKLPPSDHLPALSEEVETVLLRAYQEAYHERVPKVGITMLLVSLSMETGIQEFLDSVEVTPQQLRNISSWIHFRKKFSKEWRSLRARAHHKPKNHMNRAMTSRPTPYLDSVSQDLTLRARSGGMFPLVGRRQELDQALRILEKGLGNVLFKGEAGVGKSAMVEGVAELMAAEMVPESLQDKRLVSLEMGALVAGGNIEGKITRILHEMTLAGNVILFIDDLANVIGTGSASTGALDSAAILNQAITNNIVKVIATTTTGDYAQYLQNHDAFMRRFSAVEIREMEDDAAIQACEIHAGFLEVKHHVVFLYEAVEAAVVLSRKYIHDRFLPAKAIDLLDEAAITVKETKKTKAVVTKQDIENIVSIKTRVHVSQTNEDERDLLLHLEDRIHERIIGQDEAVTAVASALRRARAQMRDDKRPIVNLLFLGPTGVGKTELAKTVANIYFGSETAMVRLDMSEYQESGSLNRLIGAPPGYGNTTGQLTDAVRQNAASLILLDECEKAHPDILNVFLQVMDDGRLTDASGRTIDFTNTMIIATSNAGTDVIQEGMRNREPLEKIQEHLRNAVLKEYFRPEFLNRFDGVIIFKPLSFDEVIAIARLEIGKVGRQLEPKGITLQASEDALLELAKEGFDPQFGARPLRRVIQEKVDNGLATALLRREIQRRDVAILEPGGKIRIQKAKPIEIGSQTPL